MLRIYSPISAKHFTAQSFYRLSQPIAAMQRIKRAMAYIDAGDLSQTDTRANAEAYASVHYLHQNTNPSVQKAVEHYCGEPAKWIDNGPDAPKEWDAPPSLVMDTDDDFFNAMPHHAATYRWCGTKDLEGNPIPIGQGIGERDEEGNERVLWMDGENGFDIARNKAALAQWRTNLSLAALVTCSTPVVEQAVRREVQNANTFIMPNCINFDDYPEIELADHGDTVRILWQGADGHEMCLDEIKEPLARIIAKYPQTEFIFWGSAPEYIVNLLGTERVTRLPWRDYREYKLRLNGLGHDINLCPLFKHPFNEARSAIKWYESSACSRPAATLARNYAAFGAEIEDGETGLLYDTPEEFEAQLSRLIEDAVLRKTLAKNAKAWVRANRDPEVWAAALADKLESLRTIRKSFWKEPLVEEAPNESVPAQHPDVR